ncbi:hypothetical protein AAE478_007106 [Parahypoxylon ruwenzoriense]
MIRSWPTNSKDSCEGRRDGDRFVGLDLKEYRNEIQSLNSNINNGGECHAQQPITEDKTLHRR